MYIVNGHSFNVCMCAMFCLAAERVSPLLFPQHLIDLKIKITFFWDISNDKHENMCKKTTSLKSKFKTDNHLVFLRLNFLVSCTAATSVLTASS